MTIFRVLTILIALVLIAAGTQVWAQAGTASRAALSTSGVVLADDVPYNARCPRLCVEWFDGCNTCTCGKGRIDVCSQRICRWHRRPRCLRHGF